MAYATTTQLSDRLGSTLYARLTDRVNGAVASGTVAQEIIDQAEAVVDGYLARRFATPIDLVTRPELTDALRLRTLDVAEYLAWRGSPFVTDIPERARLLHDEATRWLEAVASGSLDLPAAAPPAPRVARDDGPQFEANDRAFTADELDGL